MRTSFAAVAIALASVATAQLDNIPSCALSCFVTVLTTDGCSGLTDFACHCKKTDLIPKVTPCVQTSCPADQQAKVIAAVEGTCAAAGVPISISVPGASSAASSAAASSAAASSVAASSVAASSSAAVYSSATPSSATPSSTPAASTPASSSVVTIEPTTPAYISTSTTLVGTGTVTPASNGTVSATGSPTQFTGAAAQATHAAGLMAAAAFALAAAL